MDFSQYKDKYKENEELVSIFDQIESDYNVLNDKKENAVGKEQQLRGVKQEIAKLLGAEENIPANELVNRLNDQLSGYKTKIDSFEKNASSKEIENASLNEKISNLTKGMEELQGRWKEEQATNALNTLKDNFRKALNEQRITDPNAVEVAIKANLIDAQSTEDIAGLAKSIAEANPFLTATVHNGGAGTVPSNRENNSSSSVRDVDINNKTERTNRINNRLQSRGL